MQPEPGLRRTAHRRRPAQRLASRPWQTHQRRRHDTNASQLAPHPATSKARKAHTHSSNATSPTRADMQSASSTTPSPQRAKRSRRRCNIMTFPSKSCDLSFSFSSSSTLCQNIPFSDTESLRTRRSAHFRNRHDNDPPQVPYTRLLEACPRPERNRSDFTTVFVDASTPRPHPASPFDAPATMRE